MRGTTNAMKQPHIHIPSVGEAREWAEKKFTRAWWEEATLSMVTLFLSGWVIFWLSNAFANYTYKIM